MYKVGRPSKYDPTKKEGSEPPSKPGEYRIVGEFLKYIGETGNLKRRMREHQRSGKLSPGDSFLWKQADGRSSSKTRREHERMKIKQHQPPLNQSRGGEGRIAKKK